MHIGALPGEAREPSLLFVVCGIGHVTAEVSFESH